MLKKLFKKTKYWYFIAKDNEGKTSFGVIPSNSKFFPMVVAYSLIPKPNVIDTVIEISEQDFNIIHANLSKFKSSEGEANNGQ